MTALEPVNRKTTSDLTLPALQVGDIINVLVSEPVNSTTTIPDVASKFIKCGGTYSQASYPELFAKLGLIGANHFTPRSLSTVSTVQTVAYANGLFLIGGNGGLISTSTNGITWTNRTSNTTQAVFDILYGQGLYVAFAGGPTIRSSTDGITWDTRTPGFGGGFYAASYNNGIWLIGGDSGGIVSSTDLNTWTTRTSNTTSQIRALTYGNGKFVYAGQNGALGTSTDGITWTARTSGSSTYIWSLTYGNGLYAYGGDGGTLYTSTDAITWTSRTSNTTSSIWSIGYGNGLYLYGCSNITSNYTQMGVSSDGITWISLIPVIKNNNYINRFAYGQGLYVYVGDSSNVYTSTNPLKADYSPFYDATTNFYVPSYTVSGSPTITTAAGYNNGVYQTYIKARP